LQLNEIAKMRERFDKKIKERISKVLTSSSQGPTNNANNTDDSCDSCCSLAWTAVWIFYRVVSKVNYPQFF